MPQKIKIRSHIDIQTHLSSILQDIYHQSPVLRNELINRDNISAQGQSARTNLIKMMASQRHDPEPDILLISFLLIRQYSMQCLNN